MRYWIVLAWLIAANAFAAINVRDDAGNEVVLPQPARRVVSLAPHITEMLFAAGGGNRIVGAVEYSDYPPAARDIPRVGDNNRIDIERVAALKPDLVVIWRYNSSFRQIEQLRRLGIPLYYSEMNRLDEVPDALQRLGRALDTEPQAQQNAAELRKKLHALAERYRNRPTVRVFYQVWNRPLYTLNGRHIVSDAIRLCGGENVFAKLSPAAPIVSVESVLQENPEAIVSGEGRGQASGLDMWKQYPSLLAVRRGNLFALDADMMSRPGPRMIAGAADLCAKLEQARQHQSGRE